METINEVFKLFGTIGLKDEASDKIDGVTKKAGGLTGIFKKVTGTGAKMISGLGKIAAITGIVKLTSAAFNMVRDSVGKAFSRIDTMERFERVMTTMLGSSEKAAAALDAINVVVKGTAYGLDTAASAVQNFVARGLDVDKATKYIENYGDAVAFYGDGTDEAFQRVTEAIGKAVSKGKVSMDELNVLYDQGIQAPEMYAQATGLSLEEVNKGLQNGTIGAEEFFDVVGLAMEEGTNGVTKIAGAAKEAGASWGAVFDNMAAAVARGTTKIIESIDQILTQNGMPTLRDMVAEFGVKFEEVLTKIAEYIPILVEKIQSIIEKVTELKNQFLESQWLDDFKTKIQEAKDTFQLLKDNIELVIVAIGTLAGALVLYNAAAIIAAAASGAQTIAIVALYAAEFIAAAATTLLTGAAAALGAVIAFLTSPITLVILAIGLLVAAGVLLYKNWDQVKAYASNAWGAIKTTISNAVQAAKVVVSNTFNSIKATASSVWNSIKGTTSSVWNGIKSTISSVVNGIKSTVSSVFNAIKSTASSIWNGIKSTISSVVNGIKSTVSSTFSSLSSTVTSTWNKIKSAITTPINAAKTAVQNAVNKIKSVMDFKWSLPPLKMPKFSVSGKFGLKPPSVPKLGLSWHKDGGIMEKATAFGRNGNDIMMGGEAGAEAILPLNKETLGGIGRGISDTMSNSNRQILATLEDIKANLRAAMTSDQPIYVQIDGKTIAVATKDHMDAELGGLTKKRSFGKGRK